MSVVVLIATLLGCGSEGVPVHDRVVPAACGLCVFHMPEAKTCFWAVEIDGTFHAVGGHVPPFDMAESHQPDGACKVERRARVDGRILPDGRFLADEFELLPYDGTGRVGTKEHD